jgi:hypothetical protein
VLACRWNLDIPLFGHGVELQHVGNLAFATIAIAIRGSNQMTGFTLFRFVMPLCMICFAVWHQKARQEQWMGFFADTRDGKIRSNELTLIMELLYWDFCGEKCDRPLRVGLLMAGSEVAVCSGKKKKHNPKKWR